ncbi:hypothetical protein NFI96_022663, partial [Prochilodus magdalenae]
MDVDHSVHNTELSVRRALVAQSKRIGYHEQLLQRIVQQLIQLTQARCTPPAATTTASPVPQGVLPPETTPRPGVSEPQLPHPDKFGGDPERCRGFLLQCSLVFEQQPSRFPTERAKVAYIMALLTGRALSWATPLWEQGSDSCSSVAQFSGAMRRTFFNPDGGRAAVSQLLRLRQGPRSAADYAVDFRTLGAE